MWPLNHRASARLLTGLAVVLVLALVPVAPALTQTNPVRVTQVAVKVFGETVQLSVVASGPVTYRTLQLSSPARLVIDLPGAVLDSAVPPLLEIDRGGVGRVRIGQFTDRPPVVRIAVDLMTALPFTLATTSPSVLVAKFASRGNVAAPMTSPAAPIAPPAQVAQAPATQPVPPAPVPVAQATPVSAPGRITLEFRAAELADVLTALARVCNINIVTDASAKGQVTVRLIELSCDEALRFILDANNLGFRRIGRNLIIMAAEKLVPPPEAPETVAYPIGFGVAKDVADAIRASVPGVRVTPDARSNVVIVVGTTAQQEEVRKILAGLDIQLASVMVEVRVVDVTKSVLDEYGLNWGLTSTCTPPNCNLINVTGQGPTVGAPGTPNQIVVGIGPLNINAVLTAMVTAGRARVLSAPRVAVVDGNEANVNLGDEIPIPQTDASGRTTFTFKPVGVILRIIPKINRDGLITTRVEPEVSSVVRLITSVGAQVPQIASRKASTLVTVRSGESIVIAGMISAEERRTTIKIPLLGDIPLIGFLFRAETVDRRESEVIFVITPQIVRS